eukprot:TCALIF_07358-PA protein Name:"Protein of unknown function" AED:0.13 eAED:0.13 QI:0/0.5/0.33/0.66/1/1/3/141/377
MEEIPKSPKITETRAMIEDPEVQDLTIEDPQKEDPQFENYRVDDREGKDPHVENITVEDIQGNELKVEESKVEGLKVKKPDNPSNSSQFPLRLWMSTSVCWSENTDLHGKSGYPYLLAVKLSSKLWRDQAGVSMVIQVIYNSKDATNETLKSYITDLINDGNVVYAIESNGSTCTMRAQMQRMFPYTIKEIDDNDIVITTDVDAFLLDPKLLDPFHDPQFKIWLLLYSETLTNGTTFSMSFVGMRKALWRELLKSSANPTELLEKFRETPLSNSTEAWYEDQRILSRVILESKICTAPANNSIWTQVGLPPSGLTEAETNECYYGYGLEYCNIFRPHMTGGCKWWHGNAKDDPSRVRQIYENSSITGISGYVKNETI